jgi:hypothetical protein
VNDDDKSVFKAATSFDAIAFGDDEANVLMGDFDGNRSRCRTARGGAYCVRVLVVRA